MSTPSTGTLSERYIWAASRGIPEKQRAELEPEFRELIADSIEAQRANGLSERDAEHAALVELGDRHASPRATPIGRCTSSGRVTTLTGYAC